MATLYLAEASLFGERDPGDIPLPFRLRADRYKRKEDRLRSLCCRWLLCDHLRGQGIDPRELSFFEEDHGKPRLSLEHLHFSFSHSGALSAVLVSDKPCGVDVEEVRQDLDTDLLAKKIFSKKELSAYYEAEDRRQFFTALFTKKEAEGKRQGSGIFPHQMAEIDVTNTCTERFWCGGKVYFLSLAPSNEEFETVLLGDILKTK